MSKTRDTGFLGNVVKVDASGNVSFVSGSTTLATINTSGQLSGSSPVLSSSYASNAETLDGLDSTVFTLTSSFNAQTASFTAFSSSINSFSASILATTASLNLFSSSVLTFTGSAATRLGALEAATASLYTTTSSLNAFSASVLTFTGSAATRLGALESYTSSLNNKTSSFATTGSNAFIGTQTITGSILQSGSFTSTGTLTAQTLVVQTITSSVVYSSGSNIFGNTIANTQTFTGSVLVTGSLTISTGGNVSAPTIFGSTIACSPIGCFTTSCATVALFTGCVGIGTTSPTGKLGIHSSGASITGLRISNDNGTQGDYTQILFSHDQSNLYYIGSAIRAVNADGDSTGGTLTFLTQTSSSLTEKMRITKLGIACFACQVCAPSFNSSASSTLNGLLVSCTVNSNCFTGITVVNSAGGGAEASRAGIAFQAYDWVQSAIWHGRNTAAAFSGALLFGTNPSTSNLGVGGVCTRLTIDNNGVATFACQVCAPSFIGGTMSGTSITGTSMTVATDCSGVIVDVAGRHGLMKYYNYGTGLIGCCTGTDGGISIWLGRFAGSITAPTAVYQDLKIFNSGVATFACQICAPKIQINTSTDCGQLNIIGYDNGGINIIDRRTAASGCYYSAITFRDYYLENSAEIKFYHNQYFGAGVNSIRLAFLGSDKFLLTYSGISCFAGTVCAPCFATISDYRMKSNVRPIEGLSIIMNTKPYKFEYNYDCSTSFGMIAHELQDTLPEAVFGQKDGEVMQGVDYMKLLPITIKAIQEQQCTICSQASRITLLESYLGIA